jgi:hypothetical protein
VRAVHSAQLSQVLDYALTRGAISRSAAVLSGAALIPEGRQSSSTGVKVTLSPKGWRPTHLPAGPPLPSRIYTRAERHRLGYR